MSTNKSAQFDADEFMHGREWAKWSDCREMVEDAYEAGRDSRGAELRRLSASEAALIEALSFYADQDRYNGPNQRLTEPDQWSEQAGEKAYRLDVTKDRGRIAAAALARAKEARNG